MRFLENRIPPLLVACVFMLMAWLWDSQGAENIVMRTLVSAMVIIAMVIARISVLGFIQAETTVNPLKPGATTSLVTTGIFSYSRNPMYVAMALMVFAFSLFFTGPGSLLFTVGYVAYINRFQVIPEERELEALFGNEFIAYKNRVRRWI